MNTDYVACWACTHLRSSEDEVWCSWGARLESEGILDEWKCTLAPDDLLKAEKAFAQKLADARKVLGANAL